MTRFPFRVGGILDSHPVEIYGRKPFPQILKKLLGQKIVIVEGEDTIVEKTMLQHVKDKQALTSKDYNTPWMVTVEVFEFQCADGKWQFTGAYLEE
ncbi:hypothetical protein M1B72_00980 [Geomonas paludis]|uniref:Uncharacterized protein n=1 Tax=Geomonas paludis TaxID=2740185 RepID=A0A6V8N1Y1_9BACT|nr:hypothetical protein [Geomonas paludis]UPU36308.1 hypothetical protein M1B72_00980 [Geomonas paludis]GFO66421.1 hypothetical protein GMPD_43400 [Geomonas paludis]